MLIILLTTFMVDRMELRDQEEEEEDYRPLLQQHTPPADYNAIPVFYRARRPSKVGRSHSQSQS
jgi:hypothetical protein